MTSFQKHVIGTTALINAMSYLIGFIFLLTVFSPYFSSEIITSSDLQLLLEHKSLYQLWNSIIYIVFGLSLIILVLGFHQGLSSFHPFTSQVASTVGLIWAGFILASGMIANTGIEITYRHYAHHPLQATELWLAISSVINGLGGGIELLGGLWLFLISWLSKQANYFSRSSNYLGLICGASGMLTLIPTLEYLGSVFGLTQLLWFISISYQSSKSTYKTDN